MDGIVTCQRAFDAVEVGDVELDGGDGVAEQFGHNSCGTTTYTDFTAVMEQSADDRTTEHSAASDDQYLVDIH